MKIWRKLKKSHGYALTMIKNLNLRYKSGAPLLEKGYDVKFESYPIWKVSSKKGAGGRPVSSVDQKEKYAWIKVKTVFSCSKYEQWN